MTHATDGLVVTRANEEHEQGILSLLASTLDWDAGDARHERLFRWKHRQNPFGASRGWLALDGQRVVGFRTFMCWEFEREGAPLQVVRAVDTATHPDFQGRGIFTRLTRRALEDLQDEGTRFVFNTPNDRSRPGYLKMGWRIVGRLPVAVRPSSARALRRMLSARVPAARWPEPNAAGVPARQALADGRGLAELLASRSPSSSLRTRMTPEYLAWRYGHTDLGYRALLAGRDLREGLVVFRVRRRGAAREAVLCLALAPADDAGVTARLRRRVAHETDADYVLLAHGPRIWADGYVRLPRQGPVLTWRGLRETVAPPLASWELSLGDVELF